MISKQKKKSSSQKRHKNLCKSAKDTNLGLDLRSKAPSLLISAGHSPCLGGHNFRFGGTSSQWGARPRYAPRGAGSAPVKNSSSYHRRWAQVR